MGPARAMRKAKELEYLCDVACCRRKGSGGFCEILVLANHWLFSVPPKLREGWGKRTSCLEVPCLLTEVTFEGGVLIIDHLYERISITPIYKNPIRKPLTEVNFNADASESDESFRYSVCVYLDESTQCIAQGG